MLQDKCGIMINQRTINLGKYKNTSKGGNIPDGQISLYSLWIYL